MNTSYEYVKEYLNNTVNDLFLDAGAKRDTIAIPDSYEEDIVEAINRLAYEVVKCFKYQEVE